jgi:Uma2 family endonuclease
MAPPFDHPGLLPGEEPAWEVAIVLPPQGRWTEADYLQLTESTNRMVELRNGRIAVLATPTIEHQFIVKFLLRLLDEFVEPAGLGRVLFAPMPVWLSPENFREPDVTFCFMERHRLAGGKYYRGVDLAMEVVSDDQKSRQRDYDEKRTDYAAAGVSEYWIVDPRKRLITVLALDGDTYTVHGEFRDGEQATSRLLPGFQVDVAAVFKAGER